MAIEGPLKELHLHDVFQLLDLGRKTGVFRVTSDLRQNSGTVWFDDGAVIAAQIKSNPHPLGGLLIRGGKITEEDLAQARSLQRRRPGQRIGELLVELGALGRKELEKQIRAQVEEVIFELMSWSEGYFSFEDGEPDVAEAEATIRIPTESLLMEAARRIDEWSRIEAKVPHLGVVPRFDTGENGSGARLDLLPEEWALLAAVDGATDVRGISSAVGRPEFEVAKTLFGLASAGIIVIDDPRSSRIPAADRPLAVQVARAEDHLAVGDLAEAELAAREAVSSYPDESISHLVLGRVLVSGRRSQEAVEVLSRALELDPDSATAVRLLGLAHAGAGAFDLAIECWSGWHEMAGRSTHERQHGESIKQAEAAARVLERILSQRHE